MAKTLKFFAALLIALPVFAQAQRIYTQPELDRMLAPIALYPDPLLSQVLMAATYPDELTAAARWSRFRPGLQGDDAVRAAQNEDWDPSVKSLVAFPHLLARMDEQPAWIRELGEAFVVQEPQVMETVQQLRQRAQAAGSLQSSGELRVQQQGPLILIEPASAQVVYVPYYDPRIVYGSWWWPTYQPVLWAPWPGYARAYHPGVSGQFWWGSPVGLSVNFFFGNFDWHRHHVRVVHPHAYYYRPPVIAPRAAIVERGHWQPDPRRRADFAERRELRRETRQTAPPPTQAAPAQRLQPLPPVQPVAPVVRTPVPVQAAPPARMPAASAPPLPRADRHEQRPEHRQERREHRQERAQKG
jgi:hypothetical protein